MPTDSQKHPIEHGQTNVPHDDDTLPDCGEKSFSTSPSPDSTTSPKQHMARRPRRRGRHGQKHGAPANLTMPDKLTALQMEKPPDDPVPDTISATFHTLNAHDHGERPCGRSGNGSEHECHGQGPRQASEVSGGSSAAQGLEAPGNPSQWIAMEESDDRLSSALEQYPSPSHNSHRFRKVCAGISAALPEQGMVQDCSHGVKPQLGMVK